MLCEKGKFPYCCFTNSQLQNQKIFVFLSYESLFAYTYWNKLWNRLHHMVTLEGFLKKIHKVVSKTIATAKLELFVTLFSSFQPLADFTKNLNMNAMVVLNVPLQL